jgi:hypothetical protein
MLGTILPYLIEIADFYPTQLTTCRPIGRQVVGAIIARPHSPHILHALIAAA